MAPTSREVEDLVDTLDTHRTLLRQTLRGITDEQARQRTTVSELCLAGIIKHVAAVEENWTQFIVDGTGVRGFDEAAMESHANSFLLLDGETLESVLAHYERVGKKTDEIIASLPSLDDERPLPSAPWFEPGASWSHRRTVVHIVGETAQHAGHADIIREALDGAKTMG
jgi:Protein of unknown function (DUF664)